MPINKGGNRAKRGKNNGGENVKEMIEWDFKEGEMPGRVVKSLGSKRFEVYCNDDSTRICKLRGTIRKNQWVEKGSIVILSRRMFSSDDTTAEVKEDSDSESTDDEDFTKKTKTDMEKHAAKQMTVVDNVKVEVGDILGVVNSAHYGKLKKMPGVNSILFVEIESQDEKSMQRIKDKMARGVPEGDDLGFEFDYGENNDVNNSSAKEATVNEASAKEEKEELSKEQLKAKHKATEIKRSNERTTKFISLDDL